MKEGYWVTRTYEAGEIGEKIKFFVPGTRPTGKLKRKEKDAIRKQAQNTRNCTKELARLIHANFQAGDLFMGLTYSAKGLEKILAWGRKNGLPMDSENEEIRMDAIREAAEHEMVLAIRRCKDRLKKLGIELKAIYITSDMDGSTGEMVRVHHHLIVNREAREAMMQAWEGMGNVDFEKLKKGQQDRTQLAEYMIRQVRRIPDAKKYRSTRNLNHPKPKDRVALTDAELRVPKSCELIFRQEYKRGQAQYIRYVKPEKKTGGNHGDKQRDGTGG